MRQWVKKLISQFDMEWGLDPRNQNANNHPALDMSEERATILYMLDTYSKHLFEIDTQPVRKVRQSLDEFAKGIVNPDTPDLEKLLFRLRQFFSGYRLEEFTYLQKTFEDFKGIIWDFADQLSEDIRYEEIQENDVKHNLYLLKEAVESNSIDDLRVKSREFIDLYIEVQAKKDQVRHKRINNIQKNLSSVRKKLVEVNHNMRVDHLTNAYNRMSFDEQIKKHHHLNELLKTPVSLLSVDIDFFKKINDSYGHDIGDYILKECVRLLKEVCNKEGQFVARVGGEEFMIILPDSKFKEAAQKAEEILEKVRKEVFVHEKLEIQFTVSLGVAQLLSGESITQWQKRVDQALYNSKQFGRNRYTVAPEHSYIHKVA